MADAVAVFFAMGTQWRWASAGIAGAFKVGLDYQAIAPTASGLDVEVKPRLFSDLLIMERAALAEWGKRR